MSPNDGEAREASLDSTVSHPLAVHPPPPPPPPKDKSRKSSLALSTASTVSPTRIKRKPLPATAFSPTSVISSPQSSYSHYRNEPPSPGVISSGAALNDILDSPVKHTETTHSHPSHPSHDTIGFDFSFNSQPPGPPLQKAPEINSSKPLPIIQEYRISTNEEALENPVVEESMAPGIHERPTPLRVDSVKSVKSVKAQDTTKPQSPGVFASFFGRRQNSSPQPTASPGGESATTEFSEGRSPLPSPYPGSTTSYFGHNSPTLGNGSRHASPQSSQDSTMFRGSDLTNRCAMLEAELQEISKELAGSIRRELDLEDLVERLQSGMHIPMSADRTSDYFSDSGTSSGRNHDSMMAPKEEIDKIKRDTDQQRAQLRIELSQKWQEEVAQKQILESQLQVLEGKLQQARRNDGEVSDATTRIRDLEAGLNDARRRLSTERQTRESFEELLNALKTDLEQHRNERDNLRDEIVPKLRLQIDGLESSLSDNQKQNYDFARMQQEIKHLRDENIALASARGMEQDLMRGLGQIGEDDDLSAVRSSLVLPRTGGIGRSNTVGRGSARNSLSRTSSLSRTNSILNRPLPDAPDAVTDKLNAVELQRDALQSTAKQLRERLKQQNKKHQKEVQHLQAELNRANETTDTQHRGGYEREVRVVRNEINSLRKRADDALDQKWQCEKGLSGLKMDLDRSKQETANIQSLLQARDSEDPEQLSNALESAIEDLQRLRKQSRESMGSLRAEQHFVTQLEESAERSEALAAQVRVQLEANSALRQRLMSAVETGEKNQHASATQINNLQSKLKLLEDTITSAQIHSEAAVMKHEQEISNLKEAHNAQLQRAKAGLKSPTVDKGQPNSARSPLSPLLANSMRSPRLEQTSSGPGQSLNQVLKTEFLEKKVSELEKALHDADYGMEEVVGRMNKAQIDVFELQQQRDEALKRTKKLEADVKVERERFEMLITGGVGI